MSKNNSNPVTVGQMNKAVARSHQLQGEGVDYQQAAAVACEENNILIGNGELNSDAYNELTTSNGPGCHCQFCEVHFPHNPEDDDCEPYY